jgi:tetratricopeptide (TPR) repeat protein
MVPVIGLVQVGSQGMADRYTYIPLIGPVISVVWLVTEKWGTWNKLTKALLILLTTLILAACLGRTHFQLQFWKNSDRLFQHTIEVTGENPRAEYILGLGLEHEGKVEEAMMHYRNAITSQPRVKDAFAAMGRVFAQRGQWAEATATYFTMLDDDPNDFAAHLGLASALPHVGRAAEAIGQLQAAIQHCPNTAEALNNLAWTLATSPEAGLRDGPQAVELAKRACDLTSQQETTTFGTLAAAYAEAGRYDEAIATAEKACALAQKKNETQLFQKNQELLDRYRNHQAARE